MYRPQSVVGKLTVAVAALALLFGIGWAWLHFRGDSVEYVTLSVSRGEVAPHITASGSINPVITVQVGTYVSGIIKELSCDFNTQVKRGQLCAKIDPLPYQSVVDQARANVAAEQAQLGKDQANLEFTKHTQARNVELLAGGFIPRQTLDTTNNDYQQALAQVTLDQATIKQRIAQLNAAQVNLNYTDIVSPVDGTVVSRNVTQGQTVAASFQTPTLFVIAADLTQMQVDANISESDIGAINIGNDASFTVEAYPTRLFRGQVIQVRQAPQTVQNVVTYDVIINAGNPGLLLKPGMTAATRIVTQRHVDVLRVPNQALRYVPTTLLASGNEQRTHADSSAKTVWILRAGKPVEVAVTTGLDDDAYTEIVQGNLRVDDAVIVAERTPGATEPVRNPGQSTVRVPRL